MIVVDNMSKERTSTGFLFQRKEGSLVQVYPLSATTTGRDLTTGEIFLRAYDDSKLEWRDDHHCFQIVGSKYQFRVNLTVPPGVQTYVGQLEETIGARINPKGVDCPRPMPRPRPVHYSLLCKPL